MSNKAIKKAVDYFKGAWPDCDFLFVYYKDSNAEIFDRIERETDDFFSEEKEYVITTTPLTHTGMLSCGPRFIVEKQEFEDYVRENKMEKQYKYVDAGIKTVGEFIDRLMSSEKLYCDKELMVFDSSLKLNELLEKTVFEVMNLSLESITTRQALPWYEVEGVFPCLVAVNMIDYNILNYSDRGDGHVRIAREITSKDGDTYIRTCNDKFYLPQFCTPLTPSEAAKYGVE